MSDEKGCESDYAYDSKLEYCKYKLKDVYNEKTYSDFEKYISQKVKKGEINWKHKNTPTYNTIANKWFKRWKWKECAKAYENAHIEPQKAEAFAIYNKKYLKDTITDFKIIDKIDIRITQLFRQQKEDAIDNTYRIAKLEETKNSVWHRIRERLGLDKETEDVQELVPIDDNPAWEEDSFLESRREMLWSLVNKRGDD